MQKVALLLECEGGHPTKDKGCWIMKKILSLITPPTQPCVFRTIALMIHTLRRCKGLNIAQCAAFALMVCFTLCHSLDTVRVPAQQWEIDWTRMGVGSKVRLLQWIFNISTLPWRVSQHNTPKRYNLIPGYVTCVHWLGDEPVVRSMVIMNCKNLSCGFHP